MIYDLKKKTLKNGGFRATNPSLPVPGVPKMTSDTSDAEELRITIRRRSLSLRRRHHGLGEKWAVLLGIPALNAGFMVIF